MLNQKNQKSLMKQINAIFLSSIILKIS